MNPGQPLPAVRGTRVVKRDHSVRLWSTPNRGQSPLRPRAKVMLSVAKNQEEISPVLLSSRNVHFQRCTFLEPSTAAQQIVLLLHPVCGRPHASEFLILQNADSVRSFPGCCQSSLKIVVSWLTPVKIKFGKGKIWQRRHWKCVCSRSTVLFQPGQVLFQWRCSVHSVQGDASYFTRRTVKSWWGLAAMTLWIRRKISTSVTLRRKLQETVEGALGSNAGFWNIRSEPLKQRRRVAWQRQQWGERHKTLGTASAC